MVKGCPVKVLDTGTMAVECCTMPFLTKAFLDGDTVVLDSSLKWSRLYMYILYIDMIHAL
jgi:hypothetical protein